MCSLAPGFLLMLVSTTVIPTALKHDELKVAAGRDGREDDTEHDIDMFALG
jgi:hypothetical protein